MQLYKFLYATITKDIYIFFFISNIKKVSFIHKKLKKSSK